jgi:hypothetical protein
LFQVRKQHLPKYHVANAMSKILRMGIPVVLAAAGAFAFAPRLLGRPFSIWEDLLCGGGILLVAGCMGEYRRRQEHKRLLDLRGSALW